jgi:Ser/Thr protein kinase RdoA (MazF antagonist)
LRKSGIQCAYPVKSAQGNWVETVQSQGQIFFASAFQEAEGKALAEPSDYTPKRMENWGRVLGRMHAAAKEYAPPANIHPRANWDGDQIYLCVKNGVAKGEKKLIDRFRELEAWMRSFPRTRDTYGLVHADLHQGNFFVNERDEITVFDFDDAHYQWFAYDVAVSISWVTRFLRGARAPLRWEDLAGPFWAGYRSANLLPAESFAAIARFTEYRLFVGYYWCQEWFQKNSDEKMKPKIEEVQNYCRTEIEALILRGPVRPFACPVVGEN